MACRLGVARGSPESLSVAGVAPESPAGNTPAFRVSSAASKLLLKENIEGRISY
jgi:hypothetical protein